MGLLTRARERNVMLIQIAVGSILLIVNITMAAIAAMLLEVAFVTRITGCCASRIRRNWWCWWRRSRSGFSG